MKELPGTVICLSCNNYPTIIGDNYYFCNDCGYDTMVDNNLCKFCYSPIYAGRIPGIKWSLSYQFCSNPKCPSYTILPGDTKYSKIIKHDNLYCFMQNSKSSFILNPGNYLNKGYSEIRLPKDYFLNDFIKEIINFHNQ